MKVVLVEKYDHSRLGGPMGSDDSTPTICRKLFTTLKKATDWAGKDAKKYGRDTIIGCLSPKNKAKMLGDIGPVGYGFRTMKVE